MKAQLRLRPHSVLKGEDVIEVFWNGRLICTVAGADGPGVRVISKYEAEATITPAVVLAQIPEFSSPGVTEVRLKVDR